MRILTATALASALMTTAAVAQTPAPAPQNQMTPSTQAAPVPAQGQWRASKLIGVDVYNEANEKLGEINELILTSTGQVAGAVIGVGGFLGMGEHDIMVSMDKLKFSNEADKTTTGAAKTDRDDKQWYPDRAVMNASKDQLKQMPQFKY
jgi:sporulation protein YlmC with PRC-barrel domain